MVKVEFSLNQRENTGKYFTDRMRHIIIRASQRQNGVDEVQHIIAHSRQKQSPQGWCLAMLLMRSLVEETKV